MWQSAASAIGKQIEILTASSNLDIDAAFASLAQKRADALLVAPQILFSTRRVQLLTLAARHAVPTMYHQREFVEAGGLMAYSIDLAEIYRHLANLIDKVLRGANPGDIPFYQPTKFELSINLKTAKALGLEMPAMLLGRADEVIE